MQRLPILAVAMLLFPATPEAKPAPAPLAVGAVADGQLSIDQSSVITRSGRREGWRQIQATVQLAQPVTYAAREITQEVQTQDWDCPGQRYRVILRVFRTSSGEFVRSERDIGPWSAIPKAGAERTAFEAICPAPPSE